MVLYQLDNDPCGATQAGQDKAQPGGGDGMPPFQELQRGIGAFEWLPWGGPISGHPRRSARSY